MPLASKDNKKANENRANQNGTKPPRAAKPRGGVGDWLGDRIIRCVIWLALRLPWQMRSRLMGSLVSRVLAPLAGWRTRARANLAHVWPDRPEAERHAIADAAAANAGRTMIENYDVPGLLRRMANAELAGPGVDALEQAKAEGRPVLLITGHYGNFEAPRAALVARGYRIGGLYRPMSNPYFNAHYAANMHALSDPVFEQGRRGTMGLLKHVRSGGMAVLLFDVFDGQGTAIDFLGKPAPTLLSAAEIALKTNALLLPFFGIRTGDAFTCRFEAPIPHTTAEDMMRSATRALEARIAEDPGQWFWIHRRWKPKRQSKTQRKRAAAMM